MIRHVVMWKFRSEAEGNTKLQNMEIVKEKLYDLVPIISEIKRMEIGFDITESEMSMDLMLLTEFDSVDDMNKYSVHPKHLEVAKFVRAVTEKRVVLDCKI